LGIVIVARDIRTKKEVNRINWLKYLVNSPQELPKKNKFENAANAENA
jgi:hypothetical protein